MTVTTTREAVLICRHLRVRYPDGGHALRDISFSVLAGERVAILGESGCGKSTLIRSMLGLLPERATISGSIQLCGAMGVTELVNAPARELQKLRGVSIGYVPQNPLSAFDPLRSVGYQIAESWRCHGRTIRQADLLDLVVKAEIAQGASLIDRRPSAWSGGMLQRAAIIAATALQPPLVLADEPTSALDRPLARQMLKALMESSATSLVVTHDLDLIEGLVHRIVVMYAGQIVEDTRADSFFRNPRHPYARALLAAVPRPGLLPVELPGDPPPTTAPDMGCLFAPRCAARRAICTEQPRLIEGVACHLANAGPS